MLIIFLLQGLVFADYLPELPKLQTGSCGAYACASNSKSKPEKESCIWSNTSNSYNLWPCSSGYTCNLTSTACTKNTEKLVYVNVGEACNSNSLCLVGVCTNDVCKGFGQNKTCTSHDQCDPGLRCYDGNNTCQPQIQVGQTGCKSYLDCVNWASCNTTGSSQKGTCIEYASVQLGKAVSDCVGGFSYLCSFGACTKSTLFSSIGTCIYPPVSLLPNPKSCTSSSQCTGSSGGQIVTSSCDCGLNANGTSYCAPFLGDLPGQTLIQTWKKALMLAGACNTAHRSSDGCMAKAGMLKNTTQATLGYYSYSLYQNNDNCVRLVLNNDYWMASSMILPFSILFLSLFISF